MLQPALRQLPCAASSNTNARMKARSLINWHDQSLTDTVIGDCGCTRMICYHRSRPQSWYAPIQGKRQKNAISRSIIRCLREESFSVSSIHSLILDIVLSMALDPWALLNIFRGSLQNCTGQSLLMHRSAWAKWRKGYQAVCDFSCI